MTLQRLVEDGLSRAREAGVLPRDVDRIDLANYIVAGIVGDKPPLPEFAEVKELPLFATTVIEAAEKLSGFTYAEIVGHGRSPQALMDIRHVAMFVCRHASDPTVSYPRIGRAFQRDHATVMGAVKRIQREMAYRREIRDLVLDLTALVRSANDPDQREEGAA